MKKILYLPVLAILYNTYKYIVLNASGRVFPNK